MIVKIVELTKTKGFYGTKMLGSSRSYNGFTLHVNRNAIMKNSSLLMQINYEYINNPINDLLFNTMMNMDFVQRKENIWFTVQETKF